MRTGDLRGVAEARLLTLENGPGRGQRVILARNACGLEIEIAADKGFDISAVRWNGLSIGWHSPVGGNVPTPALESEDGLGLLRGFDGFLVTCGLDHFGAPCTEDDDQSLHPLRTRAHRPLHGRISSTLASIRSYGLITDIAEPCLRFDADIVQASLFGEHLTLHRRVEIPVFGTAITIRDSVSNAGFRRARHAMLYHFNFGYPFLCEDTMLGSGYPDEVLEDFQRKPPVPEADHVETFETFESIIDSSGAGQLSIFSPGFAGGTVVAINYDGTALPSAALWRAYQAGIYAVGLEPFSTRPGLANARPDFLNPGEARDYRLDIRIEQTQPPGPEQRVRRS